MKLLYPKLASSGIRKNSRLYFPYILSCVGMVMMFYIISSLSCSPLILNMKGGSNTGAILSLGKFVIAVFALLFLFYTNSLLMRKRYREFGLYSILGMGKGEICRVVFWESVFVSVIGIAGGLGLGILFSKLAELGLLRVTRSEIGYSFTVFPKAIGFTLLIFCAIFALIMLKSLIQIRRLDPLDLMKSESAGEKPIRANRLLALLGVLVLVGAYCISVTIQSPLTAISLFFAAVIMVIVATYILFMSGSVALCGILRKNKRYYYKKEHFVSVSSMAYRMKRNGAGLASICVLSTMVLVMITSTSSLYFGADDSINNRFPRQSYLSLEVWDVANLAPEKTNAAKSCFEHEFEKFGASPENVLEYNYCTTAGLLTDGSINTDRNRVNGISLSYDDLRSITFMSADDYNKSMKTNLSVGAGEALVFAEQCTYSLPYLSVESVKFNITGKLDAFPISSDSGIPSIMLVISDYEELRPLQRTDSNDSGKANLSVRYFYSYDTSLDGDDSIELFRNVCQTLEKIDILRHSTGSLSYNVGCIYDEKDDFFSTYGGLFFLGIILSVAFISAAVLIIYYKQISEGYEDAARFEIMQNVGMTDRDIKKSINSQMLTVFSAPLIFAGLHLGFAFPIVWKLLRLFGLSNMNLVIFVNIGAFLLFALMYTVIYKLTAKAYYSIVRGK